MHDVWHWTQIEARLALAMVFALSAAAKVRSRSAYSGFRGAVTALGGRPVARAVASRPGAALPAMVPAAEAALAVCLLVPATAATALVASLVLLLVFTIALSRALRRGAAVACHCFGSSRHPVRRTQLARNAILFAVAVLGLPGSYTDVGTRAVTATALLVAVVAAAAVTWVVALWDDLADLLRAPA